MRRSIGMAVCGALVVGLAGCWELGAPAVDVTPAAPGGVRGTVILGPTCQSTQEPGAFEPVECLTPYAAQLAVLDSNDAVVKRIAAGGDGRFEVTLPPGEYVVTPESGDPYPIAQPVQVVVTAGHYTEIQINYDTGIR